MEKLIETWNIEESQEIPETLTSSVNINPWIIEPMTKASSEVDTTMTESFEV